MKEHSNVDKQKRLMSLCGSRVAGMSLILGLAFLRTESDGSVPAGAWFAQEMMQRAWARAAGDEPWPWSDAWPVARLTSHTDDTSLIVLAGGSPSALAFGPGHLGVSAMPGERGNCVFAGNGETHFRFLADLALGESLSVELLDGAQHDFDIVDLDVVDARRASLALDSDMPLLSLVCNYPFDGSDSSLRYVVTAARSG